MAYYRGDGGNYYRGDYYRGDPFLGAAIWEGAKAIGRHVLGRGARRAGRALVREAVPSAISGAIGYELGQQFAPGGAVVTAGFPIDRAAKRRKAKMFGAKPRRMNPLNPRALRRALRRSEGFEKFAKRTVNALYRVIDGRKVRTFKKRTPTAS